MKDWKDIGSNIIKLEGYGLYVTYIDSEMFISEMLPHSGHPGLDPDGCISWDLLTDPPNQIFLDLVNTRFGTSLTMNNFGKSMGVTDIIGHVEQQKEAKHTPMTDNQARWWVKNMREK